MSKTTMAIILGLLVVVAAGQAWAFDPGTGVCSVGNWVFVDNNNNGAMDEAGPDTGIPGVLVSLQALNPATGQFEPVTTGGTPRTAVTSSPGPDDTGGYYYFWDLIENVTYRVIIDPSTLPEGYVQTYERADDEDGVHLNLQSTRLVTRTPIPNWAGYFGDWDFDFGFVPAPPGEPAVELLKTSDNSAARGSTITYHFTVTNIGETPLENVFVNDPMLGGVIWGPQNMAVGQVVEFDVQYTIPITGDLTKGTYGPAINEMTTLCIVPPPPPPCEEEFTNTATVAGIWDGQTVTDEASWKVQVITYGTPAIDLTKTGPETAQRGETITYHFKVKNTGTTGLDITVNDPMLGGDIWSKTGVPAGQVNEFDIDYTIPASGVLASGTAGAATNLQTLCYGGRRSHRHHRGDGSCTPTTCNEELTNTATARGVAPCKTVTDTSSWTVTIDAGTPAIELVKTGPATARRGNTITYHFKVTNTGDTALDITVSDPMFGGTIWSKSAVPAGQINEFDIAYTIPLYGDLKSGTHGAVTNVQTLCITPPPTCDEKLVNTATATGVAPCKTVTATSTWTVTIKSVGTPGITLVKSGPATARRGDTITYTFKVTNSGGTTLNISVSDPMFGGVIWSKSAVPAGQVNQFNITYKIPLYGDLKSGTHGAVTNVQTLCTTPPPPCEEKLVNTATATGVSTCGTVSATSTWTVTVTAASSCGGYTTYTQGGWGAKPSGDNPGTLLHRNWGRVYGYGKLVVGSYKTITLSSAWAVTNFLPQSGTPNRLWNNYYNPTCRTEAGILAGQVVALTLNVDFSRVGVTKSGLGALKIQSGTYRYWTVSQLLTRAQEVLGGTAQPLGSISDLNDACTAVNENYDNGANKGFLAP